METITEFRNLAALQEVAKKRTDAVLIIDLVGQKVLFANSIAAKLIGINTNDSIEMMSTLLAHVAPADREYIKNKYKQVSNNPSVSGIEFRLLNPSSETIWLSVETVTVENNRFVYVIIRDITHAKEHEEYLVQYGTRKNTVLDTIVHQLSGSLNLMRDLASKASELSASSNQPDLGNFVALMSDNSEHCIKIIDNLIKIEYNQAPEIVVKKARVDIVKNVSYIFDEMKRNDGSRKLLFESSVPVLFVATDDFKLLQIINNLTSNALKFTREGDEIRISIQETDRSIIIAVADTGIGIPETLQPFIFQKNGPAGRTGLSGEKSNGLGLFICNHLTQLLGGRLWFESKANVGSTFFVELPKD